MTDIIAEMQVQALNWIYDNHLEAEYNKYMINKDPYKVMLPYTLIDFVIQYCNLNADMIGKRDNI